ncbi:MAG: methyltransferase domain-containing protein [Chloroflexi bacterium]|nr:methyltransferase domain-containing protein [Chloroflexota bacterium]
MSRIYRSDLRSSQNLLRRRRLVDELINRSTISAGDLVLDIGAGRGLIIERLARRGARVVAIEKDGDLVRSLRERFSRSGNVAISGGDFLRFPLPRRSYKIFANIPFNITAEVVAKLTAASNAPLDSYLGVQREAAERFCGEPRGTLWAALLKPRFEPTVVHRFRRTDFNPIPHVDVVMLRLRKRGPPLVRQSEARLYRDFVTYCFTARRSSVRETLERIFGRQRGRGLSHRVGLGATDTSGTVRFEQWLALFEAFKEAGGVTTTRVAHAERRLRIQQRVLEKGHRTRIAPDRRLGGSAVTEH